MLRDQSRVSAGGVITLMLVLLNAIILKYGLIVREEWYLLLPVTIPMLITSAVIFPVKKR